MAREIIFLLHLITSNILTNIFTNAFTYEKSKAVFYSRTSIVTIITSIYIGYVATYIVNIGKGLGLYNGLFNISSISQTFALFILIITGVILIYNSFYHQEIATPGWGEQSSSAPKHDNSKVHASYNILLQGSKSETYKIVEYALIINFIICGALFLMTSGDLISLFISLELQSYGLYILSTLHKDSEQATWGGLTYFLLGGLSSCFVLLGSSLIYINTGTTLLDGFYIINNVSNIAYKDIMEGVSSIAIDSNGLGSDFVVSTGLSYINISLIILVVGFLFKISAAPFHFWSPDVYDAIPTTVTTYVALIAKLSIFVVLLELVYYVYGEAGINLSNAYGADDIFSWKNCILLSSMLSLIIGSVLGLCQHRIKRLYAYSTISHVGFILLALCIDKIESVTAYIFYILSYTISNLNAFVILVSIGYTMYIYVHTDTQKSLTSINNKTTSLNQNELSKDVYVNNASKAEKVVNKDLDSLSNYEISSKVSKYENIFGHLNLKDVKYSPIQLISQLKGYFYINPYLALSLSITLFSFIGIPPLIGFFAKTMVLSAALDNGYMFITLIGIITSVISAAYYLNIIKFMFFFNSDYIINPILEKFYIFNTNIKSNNINLYQSHGASPKIHVRLNTALSVTISILTILLTAFIFIPNNSLGLTKLITLLLYI